MTGSRENIIRSEFRKLLRDDYERNFDELPLASLGVDSLDFFEALMNLEDDHGIVVPVNELHSTITLKELFEIAE